MHGHARAGQAVQQDLVRVSVVVVDSDRDQRHPSPRRGQECGLLVRAAVVGDLQDVSAEIGSASEQVALRLGLDIPGRK